MFSHYASLLQVGPRQPNAFAALLPLLLVVGVVLLIVMFVRKRSLGTNVNEIPSGHGSRFQTLYGLGRFMAGLGWVVAVLSIFFGIGAMASGELGGAGILIGLLIIFGGALYGIIIVALGQTMQCLVAIESNTRATASNLTPPAVAGSD